MSSNFEASNKAVIVDGLPCVDSSKYDKLLAFVKKKFGAFGTIVDIEMPKGDDDNTFGYLFILFADQTSALAALELDNKPMDKKNTFRVSLFNDYEKFQETPDEYIAPDVSSQETRKPNLEEWLLDSKLRDQYALRYFSNDHQSEIYWDNSHLKQQDVSGELAHRFGDHLSSEQKILTDIQIQWSSRGNYLASFHKQGIRLWGGPSFTTLGRLSHNEVNFLLFSPCDKYAITHSFKDEKTSSYILWDISTSSIIRTFDNIPYVSADPNTATNPESDRPRKRVYQVMTAKEFAFKWSYDGKYLARLSHHPEGNYTVGISVYAAPIFKQLDTKIIPAPQCSEFVWCPTSNKLAYVSYAVNPKNPAVTDPNRPSSISIIEIPSRKEAFTKHIFNLVNVSLIWQKSGKNLLMALTRRQKRLDTYTLSNIDFSIKTTPVYDIEAPSQPLHVEYDPINQTFGVVYETPSPRNKDIKIADVIFYKITKNQLKDVGKFTYNITPGCKAYHTKLFFSPAGGICIVAALFPATSLMQFIDTSLTKPTVVPNSEGVTDHSHYRCSHVSWDPSGRHVATYSSHDYSISQPSLDKDSFAKDSYIIWTFHGKKLYEKSLPQLFQFLWRPRPPTILTEQEIEAIKKNLKTVYWPQFEEEENKVHLLRRQEVEAKRLKIKQEWEAFRAEATKWAIEMNKESAHLYDSSKYMCTVTQEVWEVIDVNEKIIS